jgi:hypothetical protein
LKKSVGLAALRIRKMYSRSCHSGMPLLADGTIERRPRKKLVAMMSNFRPCLRQTARALGRLGLSMKP